jgi:predicted HicB family RNase H-like nuclease
VPTLASTAQYKALVDYVADLEGLAAQPMTAEQKAAYDSELTSKHGAAVLKSTALFLRGKKVASKESRTRSQAGSLKVRRAEAAEIAAVQDEYGDRLDRAADAYADELSRLEDIYQRRFAALQKQIADRRVKKAKAKDPRRKAAIQGRIDALIRRTADIRKQRGEAKAERKARYAEEEDALRAAQQRAVAAVREEGDESVAQLRKSWNRVYDRKVASLRAKRASQVADLEAKLNRGRGAIAAMPVVG